MLRTPIYLDNNATTPTDPRVLEAMWPYFTEHFGNAASRSHAFGWKAIEGVEAARTIIARVLHATAPQEIVFTSGATESDNLAIKGVAEACSHRGDHIITCQTEHKAVLDSCKTLERRGFRVTYLRPRSDGLLDLNVLKDALTHQTILVSIMHANNEIGVLQDLEAIGRLCRERDILFHTDASQSVGKVPLDVQAAHVDLVSFTAHKCYGPKGVGALFVRRSDPTVQLALQMDGGGHEFGFRSGTLNVSGIVGFGKALELCAEEMAMEMPRLACLRDKLKEGLRTIVPETHVNGHETQRLPGNLNLSFGSAAGERVLTGLPTVAFSSSSACSTGSRSPSHVLQSLGLPDDLACAAMRIGIGRFNTEAEIDYVLARCSEIVRSG